MSDFNESWTAPKWVASYSVSAALIGLPIPVLATFWALSLKSVRTYEKPVSKPLRLARLFLQISIPVYILSLTLQIINPAVLATWNSKTGGTSASIARAHEASIYLSLTGYFLAHTANIGLTMVLYLATIGSVYVVQGRVIWWKLFRVDAPVGAGLLMVMNIAWFARTMTIYSGADSISRADRWVQWLVFIVDMTLALLAAGCLGTMVYVLSKLARRGFEGLKVALGKAPTLLLLASIFWLVRCCYGVADTIKNIRLEYYDSEEDSYAWLFVYPILQHWFVTITTGLLVFAVRNSVWSDASIQPTTSNPVIASGPGVGYHQPQQYQQQYQQYPYPGQPIPMASQGPPQYGYPSTGTEQQQQQPMYYTGSPQTPEVQHVHR